MINQSENSNAGTMTPGLGNDRNPSRMVIYSPDTHSLGHLRRCLKVTAAFKALHPNLAILLLTGSPHVGKYPLLEGVDYVKLPAVVKTGGEEYGAGPLAISFEETLELRQNLIYEAVKTFSPQLMLVDHSPVGVKGELRKTLLWLKQQNPTCQLLLGMRDIIDEPEAVIAEWRSSGIHEVLESLYDRIFIFGSPEIYDPVSEYKFGVSARAKTTYTGFITDPVSEPGRPPDAGRSGEMKELFLTVGGGEDGMEIVEIYLQMLSQHRDGLQIRTTIVTGPFFAERSKRVFAREAEALHVEFKEFIPDISAHLRSADLVISMGGYNTVAELLALARKALIIPRIYPIKEQLIRSQRLSELGLVSFITPDQLTPARLYDTVSALLSSDEQPLEEARQRQVLPLDGATRLASLCSPMLNAPLTVG